MVIYFSLKLRNFADKIQDRFNNLKPVLKELENLEKMNPDSESTHERQRLYLLLHEEIQFFLRMRYPVNKIINKVLLDKEFVNKNQDLINNLNSIIEQFNNLEFLDRQIVSFLDILSKEFSALKINDIRSFAVYRHEEQIIKDRAGLPGGILGFFRRHNSTSFIRAVVLSLSFLVSSANLGCSQSEAQQEAQQNQTIGHKVLDLFKDAGTDKEDYQNLDDIINSVRTKIEFLKPFFSNNEKIPNSVNSDTKAIIEEKRIEIKRLEADIQENKERANKFKEVEAVSKLASQFVSESSIKLDILKRGLLRDVVLRTINVVLKEKGFSISEKEDIKTLPQALKNPKKFDCDTGALIYAAIGEALDYPIRIVLFPHHAFVRWDDDSKHWVFDEKDESNKNDMNWEVDGYQVSDSFYFKQIPGGYYKSKLNPDKVSNSCYLRTLNNKESLAIAYDKLAKYYEEKWNETKNKNYLDQSLNAYDTAIKLLPDWDLTHAGKARVLRELGNNEGSDEEYEKSKEVLPY